MNFLVLIAGGVDCRDQTIDMPTAFNHGANK